MTLGTVASAFDHSAITVTKNSGQEPERLASEWHHSGRAAAYQWLFWIDTQRSEGVLATHVAIDL